jgi:hypothetical protein
MKLTRRRFLHLELDSRWIGALPTVLNVGILLLNASSPSEAAVAGLHYQDLSRDQISDEQCRPL